MGVVIYNGISSSSYGIVVEHLPAYNYPERDYDVYHVPGRSGDIVIDNGSYKNVERPYDLAVASPLDQSAEFFKMANLISEFIHSGTGYARLEDTYEPDYYRMAMYKESGKIENLYGQAARTTVKFDCKPQRYLKIGDVPIVRNPSVDSREIVLINPTNYTAKPKLRIKMPNSTAQFGLYIMTGSKAYTITINSENKPFYLIIDSELKDIHYEFAYENKNDIVQLPNGFPEFEPGTTRISFTNPSSITELEVYPKWWTL